MKSAIISLAHAPLDFSFENKIQEHLAIHKYNNQHTILSTQLNILEKFNYNEIIIITGYMSLDIQNYIKENFNHLPIKFAYNIYFQEWKNSYSFILGVKNLSENSKSAVFIDGNILFNEDDFKLIDSIDEDVITSSPQTINSNQTIAFYIDSNNKLKFIENEKLCKNESLYKTSLSGDIFKFKNIERLKKINEEYKINEFNSSNIVPINDYFSNINCKNLKIIPLKTWKKIDTIKDFKN